MSSRQRPQLLDTTRTVFIRTSGTRLGTGIASLRDLNDAFQEAFGDNVTVTGFRKIGNGLIIELNSETNKNKCLGGQLSVLGLKCRVHTHTMQKPPAERQKAIQLQNSVATTQQDDNLRFQQQEQQEGCFQKRENEPTQLQTTAADRCRERVQDQKQQQQQQQHKEDHQLQAIKDALCLLDSHSVAPQATAATLDKFKSRALASLLVANATTSLMSELVRLLCDGDKEFRAHFADALASEFVHTQRRARDEELALKAEHTTVAVVTTTSMPLLAPTSQHMATLALLIGKLAGSRTLTHSEVMILVRMCAPDFAIAALSCDMFALCTMTEHMTGAPAALVGECVARLLRTERFCPPLPFALSVEIRRVCTIQSVSKVATLSSATTAPATAHEHQINLVLNTLSHLSEVRHRLATAFCLWRYLAPRWRESKARDCAVRRSTAKG
jgi:hypothetical protein